MALESNIAGVFIGVDVGLLFTIYQPGTTESDLDEDTATVQDVTGWALEWILRAAPWSATALVTKTTSAGITLTNPTSGVVTVAIADTDTDALAPRVCHHVLRRTDAGNEAVLSYGTCPLRMV